MNKRKMLILLAAIIILICGFLYYQNRKSHDEYVNPNDSGILELGINDEKDEGSFSAENNDETDARQSDSQTDQSNSLPTEQPYIPAGGEAVNNEDGSVNIVINENEETFGE